MLIEQVDEDIEGGLNVTSSRVCVTLTLVHRCKHNVAVERAQSLFWFVRTIRLIDASGKTEIDQVDSVCVLVADQNILCLYIVVQKVHLVQHSDALYLN